MNIIKKAWLKMKKRNITYKLPKEAELVRKVDSIKINKNDEYLVDNEIVDKEEFIKSLAKWARSSFIFQNHDVHLPKETKLPVEVDELLTNITFFKPTGMKALEYLILCILSIGIKIGREMEKNDNTKINNDKED